MKDILSGNKPLLTGEVEQGALDELALRSTVKEDERRMRADEANLKEGAEFLRNNAKKEGVVVLPSKILTEGDWA